ncbi:MAG: 5-bromo-4-chloroindolyl phosphate hydrolysis family protein [Acidobacteriota bacterium]
MQKLTRELVAAGLAGVVFIGASLATGVLPALGLSAAAYLGLRLVLPSPKPAQLAGGITQKELDETVRHIRRQAARFDHFGDQLRNPMRARLRRIAQVTRDIMTHLKRDPANLSLAAEFLEMHLPKALRIVEGYTQLSKQPHLDDASKARLEETHSTIEKIEKAFEAQHNRLLESDVIAFDVDRRVYEELLRLDDRVGSVERVSEFEEAAAQAQREAARE